MFILLHLLLISASIKATTVPQYTIRTRFTVDKQSIHVALTLLLERRTEPADTLRFLLNKNARIQSLSGADRALTFQFDSSGKSPNRYQPDARVLLISVASLPTGPTALSMEYDCFLGDMQKAGCAYTADYIELSGYENWFPYNDAYGKFTFRVSAQIDPSYRISGTGQVSGSPGNWLLAQDKPVDDIVLVASPLLKTKVYDQPTGAIRVDYFKLSESKADSILVNCQAVYAFYTQLFGPIEKSALTIFINPSRDRTSYARSGFISFQIKGQAISQINRGIGHEIGHFWWNRGNTDAWEDWLNESFAEYSSLLYLRQEQGVEAFDKEIGLYRRESEGLLPIRGMNRSYAQASTVLYRKGPVILHELEQRVGSPAFNQLLRETVSQKITQTNDWLRLVERLCSPADRQWIDNALDRNSVKP